MHPTMTEHVAAARRQEMLAHAEQQRLVKQALAEARALRRAERPERKTQRAVRLALRLRTDLEH